MRQKLGFVFAFALGLFWLAPCQTRATTFLQFQSTYLGNGWFQYQMSVDNDPFFTEADITSLVIQFPGETGQSSTDPNWVNSASDSTSSTWSFANGYPARPYTETFLIQSAQTSYKLGTNVFGGAIVLLSLDPADFSPLLSAGVFSQNIVGYAQMPCLVPCAPEEADGSPTNFAFTLKLLPDVSIDHLIQTNGNIYGVDFFWAYQSTFLLQGTTDMNSWTNIAYIWSWPPETQWITNQALNTYGNFFRVSLVANGHSTYLPPLSSVLAQKPFLKPQSSQGGVTPLTIRNCQVAGGKVSVAVSASPGTAIQVQALDSHRTILQTRQTVAQGASATVTFDATSLPSAVFFEAIVAP